MSTLKEREEYALSRIKESPLKVNEPSQLELPFNKENAPPNSESDTRGY